MVIVICRWTLYSFFTGFLWVKIMAVWHWGSKFIFYEMKGFNVEFNKHMEYIYIYNFWIKFYKNVFYKRGNWGDTSDFTESNIRIQDTVSI